MNKKTSSPRLLITMSPALKRIVKRTSEQRGCSQAEVVKSALYGHLRVQLEKDQEVTET